MLENVLEKKNCSLKLRITVKSLVSIGIVALAVILPQIVHLIAGQPGGVQWLPMYLPVLVGGCILGRNWGFAVGIASPIVSYFVTSGFTDPMPAPARLPFMMVELAVFASVSGAFSKRIAENGRMAFPAVILAEISGRSVFMLLAFIFQSVTPFTPAVIWSQIQIGLPAVILQAIIVPFIVIGLKNLLDRDNDND